MTEVGFHSQIKRLIGAYGEAAFKTERTNLIWKFVKDMDDGWLHKVCDGFISTSRYAPLPGEFREAARIEREATGMGYKRTTGSCGKCSDGLLFANLKHDPQSSEYVFKCYCNIGNENQERYPIWNNKWAVNYELR